MTISNTKVPNDLPGKLVYQGYHKKGYVQDLSLDAGTYVFQYNSDPLLFAPANYTTSSVQSQVRALSLGPIVLLANDTVDLTSRITQIQGAPFGSINVSFQFNSPLVQTNDYLYAASASTSSIISPQIARSSDGITWTFVSTPPTVKLASINSSHKSFVYNADVTEKFVYLGQTNSTTTGVWTSTDAVTWTSRTTPVATNTASGGSSIVINANATNKYCVNLDRTSDTILYSTDAITWTQATTVNTSALLGPVATNNTASTNQIYIYSINNTTNNILTSTDGVTWTSRTTGRTRIATGLIWFNNYYIAMGNGTNTYEYSTDGVTWTASTFSVNSGANNVNFPYITDNKLYIPVQNAGGALVSTDGISWTREFIADTTNPLYKTGESYFVSSGTDISLKPALYVRIFRLDDAPSLP